MISNEEKYNKYKPKKFLGQNFLVDENIAKKIVSSLEIKPDDIVIAVSYTHLRAHETVLDLVCRLLLEKKT